MYIHPLYRKFPSEDMNRILSQDRCELELDFPGFTNIYKYLAKIIPKYFIVIDLGCYLAPQCWYFRRHKAYIGIDTINLERFSMPNSKHYIYDIKKWIKEIYPHINLPEATFAICSYVGKKIESVVRMTFNHVFCYYPEINPSIKILS